MNTFEKSMSDFENGFLDQEHDLEWFYQNALKNCSFFVGQSLIGMATLTLMMRLKEENKDFTFENMKTVYLQEPDPFCLILEFLEKASYPFLTQLELHFAHHLFHENNENFINEWKEILKPLVTDARLLNEQVNHPQKVADGLNSLNYFLSTWFINQTLVKTKGNLSLDVLEEIMMEKSIIERLIEIFDKKTLVSKIFCNKKLFEGIKKDLDADTISYIVKSYKESLDSDDK